MVEVRERVFPVDPGELLPVVTADNRAWWEALEQGLITAQGCVGCGRARLPITPVCPHCGSTDWAWRELDGAARIFSWIRYHRSFLPEFADLMPYVVVTAELAEGVRVFGRLIAPEGYAPRIGEMIRGVVEKWPDGRCVVCFEVAEGDRN